MIDYVTADTAREWRFIMKVVDTIALILILIGAINWGLIGFFSFDLVRVIFGNMSMVSRIIYALVGIAAIYGFSYFGRLKRDM